MRSAFNQLVSTAKLLLAAPLLLWQLTATGGEITYFVNDLSGSPIAAMNQSGQVTWRENFKPYGERTRNEAAAADNKVWFTSRHQDADTGLVYMGARYYDPRLGRFLSTDPIYFTEGNVHSFNRYAYANNNPYRFIDPNGRSACGVNDECSQPGQLRAHRQELGIPDGATTVGIGFEALSRAGKEVYIDFMINAATLPVPGGPVAKAAVTPALTSKVVAAGMKSKVDDLILETLNGLGNMTSKLKVTADELLAAGEKFLGKGYTEIGKPGSGVFRSADGTRQFRIDSGSLAGSHSPGVAHGHLEVYAPGAAKPTTNNHIPFTN